MKRSAKPTLLLLTSSFPGSPSDETCGYVRDFALSLASDFDITVLAPRSAAPGSEAPGSAPREEFTLKRAWSVLPHSIDPFTADADLNHLIGSRLLIKLAATITLACFFLRAFVLALRADVVCSHWMLPCGLIGALISRTLGMPHVVIEHSGGVHLLRRMRAGRRIARLIVSSSHRVVTVSSDLKRKLVTLCPEADSKTLVIRMGTNLAAAEGSSARAGRSLSFAREGRAIPTILFIGRLTEIKGLDVLLKAISGLNEIQLIVAGDGGLRDEYERLSKDLSVNAVFHGQVSAGERRALLAECDAVVIPSRTLADGRTEGTPLVCLEAMAAGRLVVASRVGGLAEVVEDGQNGLLFTEGDHQLLREKLMLALSDDSLRERIARNARRSAEAYDWSSVAPKFVGTINDSLENGSITYRQGIATRSAE